MRAHRFFLPAESIDRESRSIHVSEPGLVSQINRVLRLKRGDQILVLDGAGGLYRCILETASAAKVEGKIIDWHAASGDPPVHVTVALPLIKGGRFEWALAKLTELGVAKVVPIICKRSVVKKVGKPSPAAKAKLTRWQAILREAAEQCERATIPSITDPLLLADFLAADRSPAGKISLICAERSDAPLLHEVLDQLKKDDPPPPNISVLVGPEGGFAQEEIASVSACGVKLVSLGPRILRSETAALYALAQIIFVLGDG